MQVHLYDSMFTHFEREEDVADLTGKLEADLKRVHVILEEATPDSVVISERDLQLDVIGRRDRARLERAEGVDVAESAVRVCDVRRRAFAAR